MSLFSPRMPGFFNGNLFISGKLSSSVVLLEETSTHPEKTPTCTCTCRGNKSNVFLGRYFNFEEQLEV